MYGKSEWEMVQEFSRKTGISDPKVDAYLKGLAECPFGVYDMSVSTVTNAPESKQEPMTIDDLKFWVDAVKNHRPRYWLQWDMPVFHRRHYFYDTAVGSDSEPEEPQDFSDLLTEEPDGKHRSGRWEEE